MRQYRSRISPTRCGAIRRAVRLAHVLPPAALSTTPPSDREPAAPPAVAPAPSLPPSGDFGRSAGVGLGGWCGH
jgi:hypothetical protein